VSKADRTDNIHIDSYRRLYLASVDVFCFLSSKRGLHLYAKDRGSPNETRRMNPIIFIHSYPVPFTGQSDRNAISFVYLVRSKFVDPATTALDL
jgi:hypothetical protein